MAGDAALSKYLSDEELTELISVFPAVEFAFAYGSGVIQQQVIRRNQAMFSTQYLSRQHSVKRSTAVHR